MAHRLRRTLLGRGVILLYHRVSDDRPDPQLLGVSTGRFERQIANLDRKYTVLTLHELAANLQRGRVPRRAVVVTFDDGFADNLWHAQPVLDRYRIPATVFVTAGYVGSTHELPSDVLERIILSSERLPEGLVLDVAGQVRPWHVGGSRPTPIEWNVQHGDDGPRTACYREIHAMLRSLPPAARKAALDQLLAQVPEAADDRPAKRVLTEEELRTLDRGGLITIGSHSRSHVRLDLQDYQTQVDEVAGSKALIEGMLGHPIDTFAYPYHGPPDGLANPTVEIVRQAGYTVACDNRPASVVRGEDPLLLPRVLVRDWDEDEFSRQIAPYV